MSVHEGHQTFRFCPCCGEGLDAKRFKPTEPERLVCKACGFVLYEDPKVAVGTIIRTADGHIVLCRRAIDPGYGRWVFPGGYVDRGEELRAAARREALEECGLDVEIEALLDVYSYPGRTPVIIVFTARAVGGVLQVSDDESLEVGVFEADTVPWVDLAFDSTREALREYFARRDSGFGRSARRGSLRPP
jgi:ADP-ribose pyrophosphatase YjhB (NUDIX family)